jgi:hypothetical protein
MRILNYKNRESSKRPSSFLRRFFLITAIIAGCVALAVLTCIALALSSVRRDISKFERKTSEDKVIGKTVPEVTAQVGPPDFVVNYPDGENNLTYKGPWGVYCRVMFRNGHAVSVSRWSK